MRLVAQGRFSLTTELPALMPTQAAYDLDRLDYPTLMLHAGYYTVRGGHDGTPLRLDYPNKEVRGTYLESLWHLWQEGTARGLPSQPQLRDWRDLLRNRDYEGFRLRLETFVSEVPGRLLGGRNRARQWHLLMHVLAQCLKLEFSSEVETWGGRADMVVRFATHACVFEIKHDLPAAAALAQVADRGYYRHLRQAPLQRIDCIGLSFLDRQAAAGQPPRRPGGCSPGRFEPWSLNMSPWICTLGKW